MKSGVNEIRYNLLVLYHFYACNKDTVDHSGAI